MSRQPTDGLVDLLHDVTRDRLLIERDDSIIRVCYVIHNGSSRPIDEYDQGEISVDIELDPNETAVPSDQFPTEKGTIAAVQQRDGEYLRPTLSMWNPAGEESDHLVKDGYTDAVAVARIELDEEA